nr:site-specific integrase [Nitrosomonas nitrosa]
MTVENLLNQYLEHQLSGKSSYHVARRIIRQLFTDLRSCNKHELTPLQVLTWHSEHRQTPHHANRALGILRAAYRWGLPLGITSHDPTIRIKKHPTESRSRYLSREELQQLLAALCQESAQFRTYVLILIYTGCRRSEARVAKWEDIDFEHGLWRKPRVKAGRWHVVPLATQAIAALRKLPHKNQWIFPGLNGAPWSKSTVAKAWVKFRKKAGLGTVRIHDLRRTAASHMVINGENLSVVQQMLDHSSLQQTAIYARLNTATLARALQAQADRIFQEVN